jgi:flavodoxin I
LNIRNILFKFDIDYQFICKFAFMKTLIIYDSYFGNTEKIAQAIAQPYGESAIAVRVADVKPEHFDGLELLVVGSPTRKFQPSEPISKFLKELDKSKVQNVKVAAFDTRIDLPTIKSKVFRFVVKTGGFAAKTIALGLQKKGGKQILAPEGFLVTDEKGPLKEGELDRAGQWLNF